MNTRQSPRGFTLLEMLVIVAIFEMLTAIIMPVFTMSREKAREASCLSNQRQLTLAITLYTQDHDELLPDANTWRDDLQIADPRLFQCPSAVQQNGYVYSAALSQAALGAFPHPEQTMVTADGMHTANSDPRWALGLQAWFSAGGTGIANAQQQVTNWTQCAKPCYTSDLNLKAPDICFSQADLLYRHTQKAVMSFLDGHVATAESIPALPSEPFINTTLAGNAQESASTPPALVARGLNGQPVIRFNTATNSCLMSANGFGIDFNNNDFTLVMVRTMSQSPDGNTPYYTILSAPGQVIRGEIYDANPANVDEEQFTQSPTTCLWGLTVSGTTYNTFINGAVADQNGSIHRPSQPGMAPVYLGRDPLNWASFYTYPASMDVAELLLFNRALSAREMSSLYVQLKGKYALP